MRENLLKECQKKVEENLLTSNTVANIVELSELADLIILKLLKETIENADQQFFGWLEANFDFFDSVIKNELLNDV